MNLSALESLSVIEAQRYARQIILPNVGPAGQKRLKAARVLIVGAGGLGSPIALYLAAAGVGTLGMVDFDHVELNNLHRQIIHSTSDVGRSKLESAQSKMAEINPFVKVTPHLGRLTNENALSIIADYDLVVDGSDNFPTRYLVNDACVLSNTPNVHGSIFRFEGMVSVFAPHLGGPCYRCVYPEIPSQGPSCEQAGVFGAICGIIGSFQASEALKIILGIGDTMLGRLMRVDVLQMQFNVFKISKDPSCAACSKVATINKENIAMSNMQNELDDISVEDVRDMRERGECFVFIDVRNQGEQEICRIDGTVLIPMGEFAKRFNEIPTDQLVVLHCHHGGRSKRALEFLRAQGYTKIKNLAGGIDRWADVVDPSMAKY